MINQNKYEHAGKLVKIKSGTLKGHDYHVEDYWDRVAGISWMNANGNPACLGYAIRSAKDNLPTDNNVLYGKIGALGHLVHTSEIGEVI